MLFNSLIFLFLFLPLTLFLVLIVPQRFKNSAVLLASLVFYAWAGVSLTLVLLGSVLMNYFAGICIDHSVSEKYRKVWFRLGVLLNILLLISFKYIPFIIDNFNAFISLFNLSPFLINNIVLPLGLSFYTFKAISYLINVKRRETPVEKNFIDLALYLSIFPQVMAGPIDRYKTLAPQLHQRRINLEMITSGIRRFSLGLFKKVVIASQLAFVADKIFNSPLIELSSPLAWLGAISYTFQIYYDFSGYTDMSIGIGRMLGFSFTENFNFPYISRSLGEFWKRWHITLSSWLRDYLFLPLAYSASRKLKKTAYAGIKSENLIFFYATLVTFLVCGIWHGAAWTFILWGLIQGILISFERTRPWKWINRNAGPLTHLYFIFFIILSMVLFRSADLGNAWSYFSTMFGFSGQIVFWSKFMEFIDREFLIVLGIAVLGSTSFFEKFYKYIKNQIKAEPLLKRNLIFHAYQIGSFILVFFFLSLASLYLISKTNTPFIYFRF